MANVKVTELTALTAADSASTDVLPVVDVSADATKKLAISDLHRSVPDGTLSAPGIAFQSDLNSGLYRSGTDAIALVTNGAARILIDATGNVTIPNDLTVQGATTFITGQTVLIEDKNIELGVVSTPTDVTADGGGITLKGATDKTIKWIDSTNAWTFNNMISVQTSVSSTAYAEIRTNADALGLNASLTAGSSASDSVALNFKTSNSGSETTKMRIDPDGKVGVGTEEPGEILHVNGTASAIKIDSNGDAALRFATGGTNKFSIYHTSGGTLNFFDNTNNANRLKIDSSGNVGIGTTSPAAGLHIDNPTNGAITQILDTDNSAVKIVFRNNTETGNNVQIGADGSSLVFVTNGTESGQFDSSGRLLVGTTSASNQNNAGGASEREAKAYIFNSISTTTERYSLAVNGASTNTAGPSINLSKTRAATDTHTVVQSGDQLGQIRFQGSDGTFYVQGARIEAEVDGTPGSQDMPGRLVFSTTADGETSPTPRMRIDSSGNVGIGTSSAFDTASGRGNISLNGESSALIALGVGGNQKLALFHSGTDCELNNQANGFLEFKTNNTPRMRITSTGNAEFNGIVKSTSDSGFVATPISTGGQFAFRATDTGGNPKATILSDGSATFAGGAAEFKSTGELQISRSNAANTLLGFYLGSVNKGFITAAGAATFSSSLDVGGIHNGNRTFNVQSNGIATINTESTGSTKVFILKTGASSSEVASIAADGTLGLGLSPSGSSKLQVNGSMRFGGSGLQTDSTNPIIYRVSGEDSLAFASGNSERMRLDNSGNLGIGTDNVQKRLHVRSDGDSYPMLVQNRTNAVSTCGIALIASGSDFADGQYASVEAISGGVGSTAHSLGFRTCASGGSPSTAMHISPAGLIGINETNPGHYLDMNIGTTNIGIKMTSADAGAYMQFADNSTTGETRIGAVGNNFKIDVNNGERLHIDSDGNVGIGTSLGTKKLTVLTTVTTACVLQSTGNNVYLQLANANDGSGNFIGGNSTSLTFWTDGGKKATITDANDGQFLVGATSGNNASDPGIKITGGSGGTVDVVINRSDNINLNHVYNMNATNNGYRYYLSADGGIRNFSSNNSNLCDEREKKNITALEDKWDKVKNWELKKFHYIGELDTDDLRYGVIAQQVETHCPEVLTSWLKQEGREAELDDDGNVVTPAQEEILRKGVKEQQMMWMAIKALQEAQARIETLEAKVAALES